MSDDQLGAAEVEVFGYGKGNGAFTRQQRESDLDAWCSTQSSTATTDDFRFNEAQTIYAGSVEAWSKCNELMAERTVFDPTVTDDGRHVAMAIRYTGGGRGGVRFYGIASEHFDCDVRAPHPDTNGYLTNDEILGRKEGVLIGPEAISVQCKRDEPNVEKIDGDTFLITPAAMISVRTASHPFQMSFAAFSDKSLPEADVDRLDAALNAANEKLAILDALIGQLQTATGDHASRIQTTEQRLTSTEAKFGRIQSGVAELTGIQSSGVMMDIKFHRPFSSKPRVVMSMENHPNDWIVVMAHDIRPDGFTARFLRFPALNWSAVQRVSWIAIEGDI